MKTYSGFDFTFYFFILAFSVSFLFVTESRDYSDNGRGLITCHYAILNNIDKFNYQEYDLRAPVDGLIIDIMNGCRDNVREDRDFVLMSKIGERYCHFKIDGDIPMVTDRPCDNDIDIVHHDTGSYIISSDDINSNETTVKISNPSYGYSGGAR